LSNSRKTIAAIQYADAKEMPTVNTAVPVTFTANARRIGVVSALGSALLIALYAVALIAGFLSLQTIGDPLFSILEILILLLMPLLIGLMVAVHAWAPEGVKVFSLMSIIFMTLLAGLTCSVHFVILTVGRHAEFSGLAWMPLFLSFKWPSISYALDILAWDGFFSLSVLCAAPVFGGNRLAVLIRVFLVASGALALSGLSGIIVGDMWIRNIGIIGYVGVFPVSALLMAVFFNRAAPHAACPSLHKPSG
jgi:hypothetical protein